MARRFALQALRYESAVDTAIINAVFRPGLNGEAERSKPKPSGPIAIKSSTQRGEWRRGRDSNPRWACTHAAFRVRCIRPLCHLSAVVIGRCRRGALDNGSWPIAQGQMWPRSAIFSVEAEIGARRCVSCVAAMPFSLPFGSNASDLAVAECPQGVFFQNPPVPHLSVAACGWTQALVKGLRSTEAAGRAATRAVLGCDKAYWGEAASARLSVLAQPCIRGLPSMT